LIFTLKKRLKSSLDPYFWFQMVEDWANAFLQKKT